jgi:hypothetical protein
MAMLEAEEYESAFLGTITSQVIHNYILTAAQLPVLARDIRKVPDGIPKTRRKASQVSPAPSIVLQTSMASDPEQSSSTAVATGASSVTSIPTTPIEPREFGAAFSPRRQSRAKPSRKARLENRTRKVSEPPSTRYWSEYDHPEDASGDENGYYIYVDPDASDKYPGQETFEYVYAKLKGLLNRNNQKAAEDEESRPILSPQIDDDALSLSPTESESGAKPRWPAAQSYGAIPRDISGPQFATYTALYNRSSSGVLANPLSSHRLLLASFTLSSSAVICIIVATLAATGRKKQRGEVDAGVVFGIVTSLFFALVGMVSVLTARESMSMIKWFIVSAVFIAVCIADGALIGWIV